MSLEKLKFWKWDWASISLVVHNLGLGMAVLLGFVWSAYTFDILGTKERATVELKQKRTQIAELNKKIEGNLSSNFVISHEFVKRENGKIGTIIEVSVHNTGTKDITFDLKASPLTVYHIEAMGDRLASDIQYKPQWFEVIGYGAKRESKTFPELKLLAGVKKVLSFYVELDTKEVYYLTFEVPVESELVQEIDKGRSLQWFASKYIATPEK